MRKYELEDYIELNINGDKRNSCKDCLIPFPAAAAYINTRIETLEKWVKTGQIMAVEVNYEDKGNPRKYRGVPVAALIEYNDKEREKRRQIFEFLIQKAKQGNSQKLPTYSDLLSHVDMTWQSPPNRNWLYAVLGKINKITVESCIEYWRDSVMPSSLVIQKATGKPSEEFFYQAIDLNLVKEKYLGTKSEWNEEECDGFWREQIHYFYEAAHDDNFWEYVEGKLE